MTAPLSEVPSRGEQGDSPVDPATSVSASLPRIPSLDILRGIGVLGGLVVSIWLFGGFSENQQTGLLIKSRGFDYRLFGTIDILLDGKMRGLIAMVFGASMILFFSRENQKDHSKAGDLFMRRQLWLMLFGLLNAIVFLWTGDLLFHLAVMGILLFPLIRLPRLSLLIASILVTLIYCGKIYWNYADDRKAYNKYLAVVAAEKKIARDSTDRAKNDSVQKAKGVVPVADSNARNKKDTLTSEQKNDKSAWEGIVSGLKYDPKKDDGEKKAMRSVSYGKLWNHLLSRSQVKEAQWTYQTGIWDFASMILLGMALFKYWFFNSRLSRQRYLLLALAGLTAGLLLGWFRLHHHQLMLKDYVKFIEGHWYNHKLFFPFERVFMAFGYASLVMALIGTRPLTRLWWGFASVGQLALTNYLLQTIFCTLFFAGFGMGYFGRLNQWQLYGLVGEICIVQIIGSVIWLRFYRYGPVEWLWRCLVYKRWIPIKREAQKTTEPATPILS